MPRAHASRFARTPAARNGWFAKFRRCFSRLHGVAAAACLLAALLAAGTSWAQPAPGPGAAPAVPAAPGAATQPAEGATPGGTPAVPQPAPGSGVPAAGGDLPTPGAAQPPPGGAVSPGAPAATQPGVTNPEAEPSIGAEPSSTVAEPGTTVPPGGTPQPGAARVAPEPPGPKDTSARPGLVLFRNLFAERPLLAGGTGGAEVPLEPGSRLTLADQRIVATGVERLRLTSPDPRVTAALRFRRTSGGWALTVVITARPRSQDYTYLTDGQRIVGGRLVPQAAYTIGKGLETELVVREAPSTGGPSGSLGGPASGSPSASTAAPSSAATSPPEPAAAPSPPSSQTVVQIVIQDEADAEFRLSREGDAIEVSIVPPTLGGKPVGATAPWYGREPLRFLDYHVLGGGYAKAVFDNDYLGWILPSSTPDHGFLEAWIGNVFGIKAATFTIDNESFALGRAVVTQQWVRGEWWSIWAEGGASAYQRTIVQTGVPTVTKSGVGWTAGLTGHLRFGPWGASVHWADTDGPSYTQVMAGWQATQRVGLALSWISYRTASPTSLALSLKF